MGSWCNEPSPTDQVVSDVVNEGGTRTYTGGIQDDLTMGLSTFGLSGEAQAEKLSEMGYSQGAIEDYQARTAETQANPPSFPDNDDDGPAPKPEPKPEEEDTPTGGGAPVVTADDIPEPPTSVADDPITPITPVDLTTEGSDAPTQPDTGAGSTTAQAGREEAETLRKTAKGPAEKKVADTVEAGRRSTIETTPQGLTTKAKTRRRRSMISGEELEEGLLS